MRLRERAGLRYYGLAIAYACVGYVLGFAALFSDLWAVNAVGTLLLAHAMIIAAYLIHECGHNAIFHRQRDNARLGVFLSWLCGAAYGTYEDMRYKHFRHHVDNADVVCFDYDRLFENRPLLTRVVKALEWFYIPAHDLMMHGAMVLTSFVIPERREQRARNVTVILIRGGLFVALLIVYPKVALLYVVAYLILIHVLRFMDSLQHDYGYTLTLYEPTVRSPHKGNREWEQEHTFSPTLSLRYPWLNLLVLNFGYHNAHHADMNLPFYRLPDKHRELTGNDPHRVIPFSAQLRVYHRNRVRRVRSERAEDYPQGRDYLAAAQSGVGRVGGNAASFLTSF
ncbi:MAG: fatty acid desaturase [Woeseiaceae bacterium]|nr:fatty acid desaturase [Woeseiaceae bacterium]